MTVPERIAAPPRIFTPAAVALLLVAPAIPVLAYLAVTRPVEAIALSLLVAVTVALLSDLTIGVCIFVAVQFALPIFPVSALTKFFGVALLARWLIDMASPTRGDDSRASPASTRSSRVSWWRRSCIRWSARSGLPRRRATVEGLAIRPQHGLARDGVCSGSKPRGLAVDRGRHRAGGADVVLLIVTRTNLETTRLSDAPWTPTSSR